MKRWQRLATRPLVLGHRGVRATAEGTVAEETVATENTMEAFERARLAGADGVEFDVQLSRDRIPHVAHDFDLTRVTGGQDRRLVHTLSRDELSEVRLGSGERIPRLEQVLDWGKQHDALLNIELKSRSPANDPIADVVAVLLATRPEDFDRLLVSSFHPTLLARLHRHLPALPTAFLFTQSHQKWLTCAWFEPLQVRALHPDARCFLQESEPSWPPSLLLNTWTVNDPDHARALNGRVDAIITDDPARILTVLGEKAPVS